jgi:hypothetical protein
MPKPPSAVFPYRHFCLYPYFQEPLENTDFIPNLSDLPIGRFAYSDLGHMTDDKSDDVREPYDPGDLTVSVPGGTIIKVVEK